MNCLPFCNRIRVRRLSIEDHELSKCVSIYDWKDRIRNLFLQLNIDWSTKYELLMNDIYELYHHHIPFHNHTHAYDVLQLGICLLMRCQVLLKKISFEQKFTFCIALICHDIDHRGHTNSDLEKTGSLHEINANELDANDDTESLNSFCSSTSHNEKHHLSTACKLFKKHTIAYDMHLFATLVAHTDLLRHQQFVENIQNKNDGLTIEDQLIILMKLADIGHILRPWKVHLHFVNAMNNERVNPLPILELPQDTINFNRTFVYDLLEIIQRINVSVFAELYAKYEENIQNWIGIKDFFSINAFPNEDSLLI